jgi:tRNA(fMet)-specific endonuclease VapC
MTLRYMLDTNIVSHIMQGRDETLLTRLAQVSISQVVMSSVTLAELEYGIHRRGQPVRLQNALVQLLMRVDVLPWDEAVARRYCAYCSNLEAQGISLSDFDMMIAAHAVEVNAVLVSRDKAFTQVGKPLQLEVW